MLRVCIVSYFSTKIFKQAEDTFQLSFNHFFKNNNNETRNMIQSVKCLLCKNRLGRQHLHKKQSWPYPWVIPELGRPEASRFSECY